MRSFSLVKHAQYFLLDTFIKITFLYKDNFLFKNTTARKESTGEVLIALAKCHHQETKIMKGGGGGGGRVKVLAPSQPRGFYEGEPCQRGQVSGRRDDRVRREDFYSSRQKLALDREHPPHLSLILNPPPHLPPPPPARFV